MKRGPPDVVEGLAGKLRCIPGALQESLCFAGVNQRAVTHAAALDVGAEDIVDDPGVQLYEVAVRGPPRECL